MNSTKSFLTSKTLWVNILTLAAMVASSFGLDLGLTEDAKAEAAVGILAVVNVILRLVTKQPLTVGGAK